jgi:ABC-type dipeptide/oligopeptide/nickel transport system permease component
MGRYISQRLVDAVLTVLLVVTLVFIAMRVLPGDPAVAALGDMATPDQLAQYRARMGLDAALPVQYVSFLWHMLRLDFGRSYVTDRSVLGEILANLPYTLELTLASMLIGGAVGIPAGVLSATRRGGWIDYVARGLSLAGFCIPDFTLGAFLLVLFALKLDLFPIMGGGTRPGDVLYHLVLPSCTLGLVMAGFTSRLTRSAMLEVLGKDYVRTARAKGASPLRVVYKHALRNALIPVTTGFGIYVLTLLSGSIAIELVFSRPGLGSLLVTGILARDYPVVQASLVVFALFVVGVNLAMDLVYVLVDPRLRVAA